MSKPSFEKNVSITIQPIARMIRGFYTFPASILFESERNNVTGFRRGCWAFFEE